MKDYLYLSDYFELFQERAAIYEYEAQMTQEEAELKAFRDIIKMRDKQRSINID